MDSDSSGDFNPKKVESDNENEEKLDNNSENNNHKEEAKEQEKKEENFNIESNEPETNNSNGKIEKTEDIKEKSNIINNNSQSISLNHGNQIIFNKRKDLIIIEIDKEKTSQKGYTVYQLNLINDNSNQFNSNLNSKKNEKKILCYRRYKDFEKFYNTLKFRFPHCIFPRLSEKNYVLAKVKDDPTFIENRRKELQFFMNKLYFHEIIGNIMTICQKNFVIQNAKKLKMIKDTGVWEFKNFPVIFQNLKKIKKVNLKKIYWLEKKNLKVKLLNI